MRSHRFFLCCILIETVNRIFVERFHSFSFQILPQVLPEVQPELSEKRWQPAGHAALPGGGVAAPLGGGEPARRLRQHVCAQQLQARTEGQESPRSNRG